jgi:3-hydroxyisobutyrate dehydrogenase-like beta-hydroxyacid dehydrogenase
MYKIPQYYSPMASHIGFIGLGIMGNEMAGRLLSEGIAGSSSSNALVVWNRSKEKCSSLQERFKDKVIIICDSPKEVVERSTITFSMLSTPEASREVFYGETGVLAGVSEGKAIVDCATLAEKDMKEMSDCVVSKGW